MNGVFLDAASLEDLSLAPLADQFDTFSVHSSSPPAQVRERIGAAAVVIVNKVRLTRDLLGSLDALRLICLVATGTDNVDLEAAAERGIAVCNCQAYGTPSVVQHVFALMLALHTNLLNYAADVNAGRWQRSSQFCLLDHPIREIHGKTLGIVGHGTLGRAVADTARGFGMKVLVAARPGSSAEGRLPLEKLLPLVDVLSLHCPLTEQTRNLIDERALGLMQPGSFLVNAARGGIVDEQALTDALRSGRLAGAAVDVLSLEPPAPDNPLLQEPLPNLIVTPHIAWASIEARQRIIDQTAENIRSYRKGIPLRRVC